MEEAVRSSPTTLFWMPLTHGWRSSTLAAVGQGLVQLAALSGYKVVSTASPRNFDFVKSLGATEVFDYKDPRVVSKIKKATGDSITKAVDAISEKSSQGLTAEALSPQGGEVILVLGSAPDATSRTDVKFKRECAVHILVLQAEMLNLHRSYLALHRAWSRICDGEQPGIPRLG